MLKMFHEAGQEGGSAAFWEAAWQDGRFEESLKFCELDPLGPLFDRHAKPGCLLLEGGCGRGHYVAYQAARGVRAFGVDFATNALAEARLRDKDLRLAAADVSRLPLRSGCIDVYYSGGVVEHFEGGPHAALREARRVLSPSGIFMVSVPYFSPLRRLLSRGGRRPWTVVDDHAVDPQDDRSVFFQYAYTVAEFEEILHGHGFRVIEIQPYSIVWGLYEMPGLGRLLSRLANGASAPAVESPTTVTGSAEMAPPAGVPIVKRLVVAEDATVPVAGLGVRLLGRLAANMMMYLCVTTDGEPPRTDA